MMDQKIQASIALTQALQLKMAMEGRGTEAGIELVNTITKNAYDWYNKLIEEEEDI